VINWYGVRENNDSVVNDGSVYARTMRRCKSWRSMMVKGSKPTSAHECTHGINSELRQAAGVRYGIEFVGRMLIAKPGTAAVLLPQPVPAKLEFPSERMFTNALYGASGRKNAFYCGEDRGITLPEPSIRKRDVVPFVPNELRSSRFGTYISGQSAWDDMPLYVFDEGVAYQQGARCGMDMVDRGEKPEKTDLVYGVLEFVIYGTALMRAVEAKAPADLEPLLEWFKWYFKQGMIIFQRGKVDFPFSGQDDLESRFASNADMMGFLDRHKIKYPILMVEDE